MNAVQDKASLHEKAVQKVAAENITAPRRTRGKAKRPSSSRVKRTHWSDGVDPRIVKWVNEQGITHDRVQRTGPHEVIVWNPGASWPTMQQSA